MGKKALSDNNNSDTPGCMMSVFMIRSCLCLVEGGIKGCKISGTDLRTRLERGLV